MMASSEGGDTRLNFVRASQSASSARRAACSNRGSPVSLLSAPNSSRKVPTPAVEVIVVSFAGTPLRRFTVPYGIPLGVSNAAHDI